jgi:hypothetical protein
MFLKVPSVLRSVNDIRTVKNTVLKIQGGYKLEDDLEGL